MKKWLMHAMLCTLSLATHIPKITAGGSAEQTLALKVFENWEQSDRDGITKKAIKNLLKQQRQFLQEHEELSRSLITQDQQKRFELLGSNNNWRLDGLKCKQLESLYHQEQHSRYVIFSAEQMEKMGFCILAHTGLINLFSNSNPILTYPISLLLHAEERERALLCNAYTQQHDMLMYIRNNTISHNNRSTAEAITKLNQKRIHMLSRL